MTSSLDSYIISYFVYFYRMYHRFRLNRGKSPLSTFEVSKIFRATRAVAKIGLSLKSNCQFKLSLIKSLIHIAFTINIVQINWVRCRKEHKTYNWSKSNYYNLANIRSSILLKWFIFAPRQMPQLEINPEHMPQKTFFLIRP